MRTRRAAERRLALVAAAVAAALLVVSGAGAQEGDPGADTAGWTGVLGGRPAPQLGQRSIVVLALPSLADRMRRAGGTAGEGQMRRWHADVRRRQRAVLVQLARRGVVATPEFTYTRVLNGFAASLDARALAVLERDPSVAGVYPVRAAYPAQAGAGEPELGVAPLATPFGTLTLPGHDGRGVVVALLDTGVDRTHPFLRGKLLPGIDILDPVGGAVAAPDPNAPGRPETHATELAGIVVGSRGPAGLRGIAPAASLLPVRVAGWQPDASGGVSVYGRTDQLLAGLEAAADPDGDGVVADAARVALLGVTEPFAGFRDGPLARAAAGALALDMLVVAPAGNDGPAGPSYGSLAGPAGAPDALTVGAVDLRSATPTAHVLLRAGVRVLVSGAQPLGGTVRPAQMLQAPVAKAPRQGPRRQGIAAYFGPRGRSLVAGRAALLPPGVRSPEAVRLVAAAGASAVLVEGALPAGALGPLEGVDVPVLGLEAGLAREVRALLARRVPVTFAAGAPESGANEGMTEAAPFTSRGLAYDGGGKPELGASGVGVVTSTAGRPEGRARYTALSGSSVSAAVAAGAAAVLASARPDLDARGLRAALVAGAHSLPSDLDATGAGLVDLAAAASTELAADPPSASLGAVVSAGQQVSGSITVRNLSSRRLDVRYRVPARGPRGLVVGVRPSSFRLVPGESRRLELIVLAEVLPQAPAALRGVVRLPVRGGRPLRVRWSAAVPLQGVPLLRDVRLSRPAFRPSDADPAVLTLLAGRVDGRTGRPQLLPLERLDVELFRGERRLGRLARLRGVLPGRYAFGLTGRDARGKRLRKGSYEVRVLGYPVYGGEPGVVRVPFRIR